MRDLIRLDEIVSARIPQSEAENFALGSRLTLKSGKEIVVDCDYKALTAALIDNGLTLFTNPSEQGDNRENG